MSPTTTTTTTTTNALRIDQHRTATRYGNRPRLQDAIEIHNSLQHTVQRTHTIVDKPWLGLDTGAEIAIFSLSLSLPPSLPPSLHRNPIYHLHRFNHFLTSDVKKSPIKLQTSWWWWVFNSHCLLLQRAKKEFNLDFWI